MIPYILLYLGVETLTLEFCSDLIFSKTPILLLLRNQKIEAQSATLPSR